MCSVNVRWVKNNKMFFMIFRVFFHCILMLRMDNSEICFLNFCCWKDSGVTSLGRGSIIPSEHVSQIDCPTKEIIYTYVCVCKISISSFWFTLFLQRVLPPWNRAQPKLRGSERCFCYIWVWGWGVLTGLQTRLRHKFENAPSVWWVIQVWKPTLARI